MKLAILLGIIKLTTSDSFGVEEFDVPSTSCEGKVLTIDCVNQGDTDHTHNFDVDGCDPEQFTCDAINNYCQTAEPDLYVPINCTAEEDENSGGRRLLKDLAGDVRRLAYPPINPFGNDQMCTFYDGQPNWFSTPFTQWFTARWCWGWMCRQLPNYGSACYCIINNGEYWYGDLDLSYYDVPTITFDYTFVADWQPKTTINMAIDCGYGWQQLDQLVWDNAYYVKKKEFKCEGKTKHWYDNYDYYHKRLPLQCGNSGSVKLKFCLNENYPYGTGKWFGIKNLCVVDAKHAINKCMGPINPWVDICKLGYECDKCLHKNAIHGDFTCHDKISYGLDKHNNNIKGCPAGTKWCGQSYGCTDKDCTPGSCVTENNKNGVCWPKIWDDCYPGTVKCNPVSKGP